MRIYYFVFDKSLCKDSTGVRSVLCIGDGFVEGFGDRFAIGSLTGLCNRITDAVRKEKKTRLRWQFINGGKYGSTSADWLPSDPHSLYWKIAERYRDAPIVIIMLGSIDTVKSDIISPTETIENIEELANEFLKAGKTVFIATIPHTNVEKVKKCKRKRNQLLREMIEQSSENLLLGPECDSFMFTKKMYNSEVDHFHFNPQGYKLLAREWAELLIPSLVKVEFQTWSKLLGYNK